jgi:nucleotide-binding universal stress UspA family protein
MYKHILIPTDGSKLAETAVQHGIALAKAIGAKITALTVSEPFHIIAVNPEMLEDTPASYKKRTGEHAARILGAVASAAQAAGVACETVHVKEEHPYKAIIDTAKSQQCDLIVMASHGRRGMSAIVLGSETVKVLTHSSTPVLVYR